MLEGRLHFSFLSFEATFVLIAGKVVHFQRRSIIEDVRRNFSYEQRLRTRNNNHGCLVVVILSNIPIREILARRKSRLVESRTKQKLCLKVCTEVHLIALFSWPCLTLSYLLS